MFRRVAPWTLLLVFMAISLAAVGSFILVIFAGATPTWLAPGDLGDATPPSAADALRQRLLAPVNLDKGIDPNTPLKDALEFLSDRYDVSIIIDSHAFAMIDVQKVEEQPVALPKMVGIELRTVLRLLLGQVGNGSDNGAYLVRGNTIIVTTTAHLNSANWHHEKFTPPSVDVDCRGQSLREALRSVSDQSGINVLLDGRAAAKFSRPLTAQLQDVRVDEAVRLLAHMGGLKAVISDNVIYVTDPDQAAQLQADVDARVARRRTGVGTPVRTAANNQADDPAPGKPSPCPAADDDHAVKNP